jgi:glycine cleavage system regulatory protein
MGEDRPGLVGLLSQVVAAHGGNWLESRMAHLAGHFAGILRVDVPSDQAAALEIALLALEAQGLQIVVVASRQREALGVSLTLGLVGHDRPGIVRELSRELTKRGVNVEELSSEAVSAPMSGERLFKAEARLRVPSPEVIPALRAALEDLAGDLMVDIELHEDH